MSSHAPNVMTAADAANGAPITPGGGARGVRKPQRTRWERFKATRVWRFRALYVMMAPALIWFIIYRYAPMGGLLIAFKDYNFVDGIFGSPWADPWYTYFQQFFQSPYFAQLLSNTAVISVLKMFWGTVPSIFVALLFYECRVLWLRKWVQTLSYMPHFMSWVIIFGISAAFLAPSTGLLNRWLGAIDIGPIAFLTSNDWFQTILVGTDAWKDLGWGAIIYFAAMMGIDQQLYEAARVDGASRLRQIWHITLPGILTVIVMLFILKLGNVLEAGFEHVYVFISPQVYPTGDIIDTWVYRTGLEDLNFALASAVGMFKSVIGLVLVLAANRLARRWGGQLW